MDDLENPFESNIVDLNHHYILIKNLAQWNSENNCEEISNK